MYRQRENNPHFLPLQPPWHQPPAPQSQQHDFSLELPTQPYSQKQNKRGRPQHGPGLRSPTHLQPRPDLQYPTQSQPRRQHQPSQARKTNDLHIAPTPTPQPHQQPMHSDQSVHPSQQSSFQRIPQPRKTKPFAWCIAIVCALFWIIIILGGLIVLIVYLVFHPKSPKFDVAEASLNAVYLDMGYLLNADVTLMVNFTNPNKKVNVNFNYIVIILYHDGIPIATKYIDHFSIMRTQYLLTNIHMVTSQVKLSPQRSRNLKKQIQSGRVQFEIKGIFKTKSRLGSILRYSYWLYGRCNIVISDPPSGILVAKTCGTKR